jgi:5-formyltetrahydrofolate cyclo-ligase
MTSPDLDSTKINMRTMMLEKRRVFVERMASGALAALHQRIVELVLKTLEFTADSVIAGYWPLQTELDARPLMMVLAERGHTLCLPVVGEGQGFLSFKQWKPGVALERGRFGVMIPSKTSEVCSPTVLFVPLLAWNKDGHRLGYGQGYYDRTLAELRSRKIITAIGFGYECQYSETLPIEPTDQPLDAIITEQRIVKLNYETSLLR